MPYVSDKQRRFFHTQTAREHGITPQMVQEYDQASKGRKLPERAHKDKAARNKKIIHDAILNRVS